MTLPRADVEMSSNETTEQTRLRAVVAGNYREFRNYCREQGIAPDRKRIFFVHDEHSFIGMTNIEIVYYGTWYERKDAQSILRHVHAICELGRAIEIKSRTQIVDEVSNDAKRFLHEIRFNRGLTTTEYLQILTEEIQSSFLRNSRG